MIQAGMFNKDSEGIGLYGHLLNGKLLNDLIKKVTRTIYFLKTIPLCVSDQ